MRPPPETSSSPTAGTVEPGAGAPAPPPLVDGRYRLEERLGEGALGAVWRARHVVLCRDFALKLLHAGALADPAVRARFYREAEALGRLRHPHIVEVTDFGVDPRSGAPYLVMELLPGRTLADLLREEGPLPPARALRLLEALAGAVDAAHGEGILHRDLKPSNVAVPPEASGQTRLKVLDFGLAQISVPQRPEIPELPEAAGETLGDQGLTSTGMLLGTPLYAAPEVIRGAAASRASDIYSFGVIAYEMLTGRPPFQGTTSKVLSAHLHVVPPAPGLPETLGNALHTALHKEPGGRPASAGSFVRRLRRAIERTAFVRWRRAELPRRAGLAAGVVALSLAGLLHSSASYLPVELKLEDLQMQTAPSPRPDPRILLVSMDDSSLREGDPLINRANEVGRAITAIFAAGARGVAVNLVLPHQWKDAPDFQYAVLHHADRLTLAALSGEKQVVEGADCISDLVIAALGPKRAAAPFGFVNLEEDSDHVIRRGSLFFRDDEGGKRPSWAARAASTFGDVAPQRPADPTFRIDYRIDSRLYRPLPWRDLPAALADHPELFQDRLILIGGAFLGEDHPVPGHRRISGQILQALLVDTIAAGLPVRQAPRWIFLSLATVASAGAALSVLLSRRPGLIATVGTGLGALYATAVFLVFQRSGLLLPLIAPELLLALVLALALLLRRRLPPAPSTELTS